MSEQAKIIEELRAMLATVNRPCPYQPGDVVRCWNKDKFFQLDKGSYAIVVKPTPRPVHENTADMQILYSSPSDKPDEPDEWHIGYVESWKYELVNRLGDPVSEPHEPLMSPTIPSPRIDPHPPMPVRAVDLVHRKLPEASRALQRSKPVPVRAVDKMHWK